MSILGMLLSLRRSQGLGSSVPGTRAKTRYSYYPTGHALVFEHRSLVAVGAEPQRRDMVLESPPVINSSRICLLEDGASQGHCGLLAPSSVAWFQKQECSRSLWLSLSGVWVIELRDRAISCSHFGGVNVLLDFPHYTANLSIPLPSATVSTSLHLHPTLCLWQGHYGGLLGGSGPRASTPVWQGPPRSVHARS